MKGGPSKEAVSGEGRLVWGTYTLVTSRAGLTKGGGLSKVIPLYGRGQYILAQYVSIYAHICECVFV